MIPSMSLESSSGLPGSGQRWRLLDDPTVIRALAHPLRLDLISIVGRLGQATTADAARELGVSHGLASHHLRQLAKYGFVEHASGKDNRERPWRLTITSWRVPQTERTPEGTAAAEVLEQVMAERALDRFLDWQRRRRDWPAAWVEHSGIGTSTVYLTQPELAELVAAMDALIRRYVDERVLDDVAARPPGAVPVDFTLFAVPGSENPPGPENPPEET